MEPVRDPNSSVQKMMIYIDLYYSVYLMNNELILDVENYKCCKFAPFQT
jgi:hypothetical protein